MRLDKMLNLGKNLFLGEAGEGVADPCGSGHARDSDSLGIFVLIRVTQVVLGIVGFFVVVYILGEILHDGR